LNRKYNISILPNPAQSYFTITGAFAYHTIAITDVSGRVLKQLKKQPNDRYEIAGMAKGVYFIRLINEKETTAVKLIVE
jgi:hypothetical protein